MFISISLLSPEFVLNKFYPKFNQIEINEISKIKLDPEREVRFKVTRFTEYGERYKLFVIDKNSFEEEYNLADYGINIIIDNNKFIVDTLKWNGKAKKSGFETGDFISEFKIENDKRPSKLIIYPFAILLLLIFGYLNSKNKILSSRT